jgi:hypothetical protein
VNFNDESGLFQQAQEQPPIPTSPFPVYHGSDRQADQQSRAEMIQDEWDNLSADCQKGLKMAVPGSISGQIAALNRAWTSTIIDDAATANAIDPALLAAIAIRETGFRNIHQTNGQAVGIFQIDLGQNPGVTGAQASNPAWAAKYLSGTAAALANSYPNLAGGAALGGSSDFSGAFTRAWADTYNLGLGGVKAFLNAGLDPDLGTTGENYGQNMLQLMQCFK